MASRYASLIRDHPVVVYLSLVTMVIGLATSIPTAFGAVSDALGISRCLSLSGTYQMAGGTFTKRGRFWSEVTGSGATFEFEEFRRDRDYIYLKNLTPRVSLSSYDGDDRSKLMWVRIPLCGGMLQWSYENPIMWTDLGPIRR